MIKAISTGFGAFAQAAPIGHPAIPAVARIAAVKLMSGFAIDSPLDVLAMPFSLLPVALASPDDLMIHMPR
jgi:hypothetical protein